MHGGNNALVIAAIIAVIALVLFFGSNFSWQMPGKLYVDGIKIPCEANSLEVYLVDLNRQSGDVVSNQGFDHDNSELYTCSSWNSLRYNQVPVKLVSATWGSYDVSSIVTVRNEQNVLGAWQTKIITNNLAGYVLSRYGIPDGNAYKYNFNVAVKFERDACQGVTCQPIVSTCADGYTASCDTQCESGTCTTCIPDCTGHENPPQECVTKDDCSCITMQGVTCECTNNKCVSEKIEEINYNIYLACGTLILVILIIALFIIKNR